MTGIVNKIEERLNGSGSPATHFACGLVSTSSSAAAQTEKPIKLSDHFAGQSPDSILAFHSKRADDRVLWQLAGGRGRLRAEVGSQSAMNPSGFGADTFGRYARRANRPASARLAAFS